MIGEDAVSLAAKVMRRVEPAVIRYYQWRGDPLARWMRPQTKTDPYPLYADIRRRPLVRSALGAWMTADHAAAESILRDRRFSSSPVHQRGYRPPAYPAGDPRAELPAADLLTMDPPDHTRIRRLVSGAFTPKAIAAWSRGSARSPAGSSPLPTPRQASISSTRWPSRCPSR